MGFWVYGRWDFGPLAFETGNLKLQCKVRSSPKPNNARPPFVSSAVHHRPPVFGLWVWLLVVCSWPPALIIISTSAVGARIKFSSSAAVFGFWLWVFGPLGLGVWDLGFLINGGCASGPSGAAGALGLGGCRHGVEVLSCHRRGAHRPGNIPWCPGCHGVSARS